jgi:hypothetical protein
MLNWQQAVFESEKQGAHENNCKLHGEDWKLHFIFTSPHQLYFS